MYANVRVFLNSIIATILLVFLIKIVQYKV